MLKNTGEMRERNKSMKGTKEWKNRDKNDNRMNNKIDVKEYRRNGGRKYEDTKVNREKEKRNGFSCHL
jgi:hypothetical protein